MGRVPKGFLRIKFSAKNRRPDGHRLVLNFKCFEYYDGVWEFSREIYLEDGTRAVHYFTQEEGAVMLDPDVKKHFPDSTAVNRALRSLIPRHKVVFQIGRWIVLKKRR